LGFLNIFKEQNFELLRFFVLVKECLVTIQIFVLQIKTPLYYSTFLVDNVLEHFDVSN